MKRPVLLLHLFAICLVMTANIAVAQDYLSATGNPSFGVNIPVENGFINVSNGNLHLEIPLAKHPQRGALVLNEKLVYDSRIWMIGHYSNYYWWPSNIPNTPYTQGGWRFVTGAETGSISYQIVSHRHVLCLANGKGSHDFYVSAITWTDSTGTGHRFDAPVNEEDNNCDSEPDTPYSKVTLSSGYAIDASGYQVKGDGQGNPNVWDNNGTMVYPQVIDRYGNYWSTDSNGNLIDDVGRTPVIVTTNGNVTYYDVLAANGPISNNGTRVRYTVTTAPVSVSTQFNESPVNEWSGTLYPVQSIQLPDGSSYTFGYDSYGGLSDLTLPTGGIIHYGWVNYFDSYQNENRWLITRKVGNGPEFASLYRLF